MNNEELTTWFEQNKKILETAYLTGTLPWQQSGFGLHTPRSAQDWEALRRPIDACIVSAGTFLDIGCANGYLLECMLRWTQERGIQVTPYGLDFSEKLVALAWARLPQYASHLFVGNTWDWEPPMTFDYVNTTLDYVPHELHKAFVNRLLAACRRERDNSPASCSNKRAHPSWQRQKRLKEPSHRQNIANTAVLCKLEGARHPCATPRIRCESV